MSALDADTDHKIEDAIPEACERGIEERRVFEAVPNVPIGKEEDIDEPSPLDRLIEDRRPLDDRSRGPRPENRIPYGRGPSVPFADDPLRARGFADEARYRNKRMIQWHKRPMKYKYYAPDGKKLAAGGIFFFEERDIGKGLWLVEEEEMGVKVYTDFGGKYDHNDGDINATISREFREETYNTAEIPYERIEAIPENCRIYIDGYDKKPVYVCVVVDISTFGIKFDREKIKEKREVIGRANPQIPERWYKTLDVKFVPLKEIMSARAKVSNRLYAILAMLCEKRSTYDVIIQKFFEGFEIRR